MERRTVYFFHIPKTAGVSVWRFIEQSFPPTEICPWWLWDQLITVPRAELDRWHVFRGHFMSYLEPYLGKPVTKFTILRDPVERTISHYCHVRRAPDHPYHAHALRMSLGEFCSDPETRHMIENFQSVYLAKSQLDPVKIGRELSPEQLSHFELQRRLENSERISDPDVLFDTARNRLTTFSAVGFAEIFGESLLKISQALGCPPPKVFARENAAPKRMRVENVDEGTLALIRNLTVIDRRLCEFAQSVFASGATV